MLIFLRSTVEVTTDIVHSIVSSGTVRGKSTVESRRCPLAAWLHRLAPGTARRRIARIVVSLVYRHTIRIKVDLENH